jgi:DNA topoisomerase-3
MESQGMTFVPTEMMLSDGRTAPPGHLQEADLLGLMDRHGIGTDATMAQHIKKQTERRYALKEGTTFRPTALGEALVMAYVHMGMDNMWKPMLRSAMEKQVCGWVPHAVRHVGRRVVSCRLSR